MMEKKRKYLHKFFSRPSEAFIIQKNHFFHVKKVYCIVSIYRIVSYYFILGFYFTQCIARLRAQSIKILWCCKQVLFILVFV